MSERDLPWIVSTDDHVIEPPHVWRDWLPARFRDRGPRVARRGIARIEWKGAAAYAEVFDDASPMKGDVWVYDGRAVYTPKRNIAAAGYPKESWTGDPVTYDQMRPGCYEPAARLADMDLNWVEASLCYPTLPRFCGQTFLEGPDKELGSACVTAYNDWLVDEWCGSSAGRLVPVCLVPLWDPVAAAAEVRRNAARGVRAVAFSEIPHHLGLPSVHTDHWDPLFAACQETGTVVCMHIGSSSKMPATSPDAPPAVTATLAFGNSMASLVDFLFSGVLVRFPALQLSYAESQIGWLPYVLERVDDVWEDNQAWAVTKHIPEPPSGYYHRNVSVSFFKDGTGVENLGRVNPDNVCYETDYPHGDTTWPGSKAAVTALLAGVDDDAVRKIVRGNAIRLFQLDLVP
ncbi:MAG: amidohydrolase family protein [Acidimicrobiia bacterium]